MSASPAMTPAFAASRRSISWVLLLVAAGARLLLQMSLMPPYAGLDEIYHAARLTFVAAEKRNPTSAELSISDSLERSLEQRSDAVPAFGVIKARWPEVVASGARIPARETVTSPRPYRRANYEAQQPSLYYSLVGLMSAPDRTSMYQLRIWRSWSLFFALIVVLTTAWIGEFFFGPAALIAAALIVSLPTWLTLVLRAGNDAFACALLAVAVAITVSAPRRLGSILFEGAAWALALAAKLYVWPAAIVLPLFWREQRSPRRRVLVVAVLCAVSLGLTVADLHLRTRNPLGAFAFDPVPAALKPHAEVAIDFGQMIRIFLATLVWTSGEHGNALTGVGMALYVVPILALLCWPVAVMAESSDRRLLLIAGASVVAYLCALAVNAAGYMRVARMQGASLPAGGKEGWYLYAFVPILVGLGMAGACRVLLTVRPLFPRGILTVLVFLVLFWDVRIHEGALFRDWAGSSSDAHHSLLFRWGARTASPSIYYAPLAVGPLDQYAAFLRSLHVVATVALLGLLLRSPDPRA